MDKEDLNIQEFLNFISDGYLTSDFKIFDTFITFKTITQKEQETISENYKFLSEKFNIFRILDILTYSIDSIGGSPTTDRIKIGSILAKTNLEVVLFLYQEQKKLEKKISEFAKNLNQYVKHDDSREYWRIYSKFHKNIELKDIKTMNGFLYQWCLYNINQDMIEEEKRAWSKFEYMTGYICAFLNPKEYRRIKDGMNITKKFDEGDNSFTGEFGNPDDIYDTRQRKGESKLEFEQRLNYLMNMQMSGEVVDESDKIIQDMEVKQLKNQLFGARKKNEIRKALNERNKNEEDYLEITEKKVEGEFCYNNFDYSSIMNSQNYMTIPKKLKLEIFAEIMNFQYDLEKEIEKHLNTFRTDKNVNKETNLDQIYFKPTD